MIGQGDGTIYFPPTFYAVQQFSRYIRPGAKIHASSGAAAGLMSLAGVNENGSLSVVVFNESAAPVTYQASYMGQAVEATVPGPGIQTIEFK
jgi:glucosylceramidase